MAVLAEQIYKKTRAFHNALEKHILFSNIIIYENPTSQI